MKKITVFLAIGIIFILISILGLILVLASGINGAMLGGYLIILLLPALIIISIDRFFVWKLGAQRVNIISVYILAGLFALGLINSITGNSIIRLINVLID